MLCIEESSRTNIFYIASYNQAGGSKKVLQVMPTKLGTSNLEMQDLCSVESSNAGLQTIHCMKSLPTAAKSEYLLIGGVKNILILKLTKSVYLQFFSKITGILEGPIMDIKVAHLFVFACGSGSKPVGIMKFPEAFTITQDKFDFSSFEKPVVIELGPTSTRM